MKSPKAAWFAQLVRYTIASSASFALDMAILAALIEWAKMSYLPASIIGYVLTLFVDYGAAVLWVFSHRRLADKRTIEFAAFAGIGFVGLAVNTAAMALASELLSIHYVFAKILAGASVLLFTFILRKTALFTRGPARAQPSQVALR